MTTQQRYYAFLFSLLFFFLFSVLFVSGAPLTGTLTPLTIENSSVFPNEPAVSGDFIVWRDDRTGDNNIYLYDISTGEERQLTDTSMYWEEKPVISDRFVAWQDDLWEGDGYDIVLYNLETETGIRIASGIGDQTDPSIDGDILVWQDTRNGANSDIYLYSITSETEMQVSSADGDQVFPRISGNIIVWENTTFSPRRITMYDYAGNQTPFSPVSFGSDEDQTRPVIKNNYLAWSDNHEDASYYRIYRMDITTGDILGITPESGNHFYPDIDGTRVVWIENDDIYLNDTAVSESETQITLTGGEITKDNLRISADRLVWHESGGSSDMVYLFTIGDEETCPDADFTISPSQSGPVPLTISFTDTSTDPPGNPISHWSWDFGDGNHSSLQNPDWTYEVPGNYDVQLIVDNPLCRNATEIDPGYQITAGAAPVAAITVDISSGMVPLTVTFTDISPSATSWNWDFGDGTTAATNPATHTYTTGGTFTVHLQDSNEWGTSDAEITIYATTGADESASTDINGIIVDDRFGGQFLTYDGTILPGYLLPETSILVSPSLTGYGWQKITFLSDDGIGFQDFGNDTVMGNLTGAILNSNDIFPAGFSEETGSQSSINYSLDLTRYPTDGTINSQVWEDALPSDLDKFERIGHGSGWSHILGTAYTMKFSKTHFSPSSPATLYFSVNSTWLADKLGRDHTYLMRIGDNDRGEVLPTEYLYSDLAINLDYFKADSPRGLSTFGLVQLAGSGNLFQLISLSVADESGTDENSPKASVTPEVTQSPLATPSAIPTPTPAVLEFPLVTADIYSNPQGIITQKSRLLSADGRASLIIGEGITALDAGGSPLAAISIGPPAKSDISRTSPDSYRYSGIGYNLGPDGATFSPPVNLTFTVPEMGWNSEYMIREYDPTTQVWRDLPTSVHPDSGTVSAEVSHFCCIGLFSRTIQNPTVSPARATPSAPETIAPPSPPPSTAVDIFINIVAWIGKILVQNFLVICTAVIVLIIIWFAGRRKRRDKIRYML